MCNREPTPLSSRKPLAAIRDLTERGAASVKIPHIRDAFSGVTASHSTEKNRCTGGEAFGLSSPPG